MFRGNPHLTCAHGQPCLLKEEETTPDGIVCTLGSAPKEEWGQPNALITAIY